MDRTFNLTLSSTRTAIFVDRTFKPALTSIRTAFSVDRVGHDCYTSPTNPSVATLIRTDGGNSARSASKQAKAVDPVVNT